MLARLFADQPGQRGGTRTFGGVVGGFMVDPNGVGDLLIGYPDNPSRALGNYLQRLRQRLTTGQSVSEGIGGVRANQAALFDTFRKGIGLAGYDADNLGL